MHANNLLQMLVADDDASLSFGAASGDLETNSKSCGLNAEVSRTRRS